MCSESLVCIHRRLDFCCCLTIAPVVEVDDVVSCCGKRYLCTFFIHLLAIYHLWGRRESHHIVLGATFYVYVERIGLYLLVVGSESLVFCHSVFEFALSRKHCAVLVCPVDKIITEFIGCSQCYLVVLLIFVRLRIDGNVCDAFRVGNGREFVFVYCNECSVDGAFDSNRTENSLLVRSYTDSRCQIEAFGTSQGCLLFCCQCDFKLMDSGLQPT